MAEIIIKVCEQTFTTDTQPYLTHTVTVEHYENISDGEKFVLEKIIPAIKSAIKEYENNY